MGLEELQKEIITKAEGEASKILAQANAEADKIKDSARSEVAVKKEKADQETKKILEMIEKREVASTSLESKKLMMGAKRDVIEEVFSKAEKKLGKLPKADRQKIIESLLKKANILFDTSGRSVNALPELLKRFGADKFAMGTHSPILDYLTGLLRIESLRGEEASETEKDLMRSGNAKRILGI